MDAQVTGLRAGLQSALRLAFPPRCILCEATVSTDFGLCANCWRDTVFIGGLVCDLCGTPLPGEDAGQAEHCDDCRTIARPWAKGRAAILYKDKGRELVLALKHGDRLDLVRPAAGWMARAALPMLLAGAPPVVVPIPLHWMRLLTRRYNQSAELARRIARSLSLDCCPDALRRVRGTGTQDGRSRDGRFANLDGALQVAPSRFGRVKGRTVLLVDDVMTSGATFAAATEACLAAGATQVSVLALARVAKDA